MINNHLCVVNNDLRLAFRARTLLMNGECRLFAISALSTCCPITKNAKSAAGLCHTVLRERQLLSSLSAKSGVVGGLETFVLHRNFIVTELPFVENVL